MTGEAILQRWRIYGKLRAATVAGYDPADLAVAIYRLYRPEVVGLFEVRLKLDEDLYPTGTGIVMRSDSWGLIDRLKLRRLPDAEILCAAGGAA